MQYPGDTGAGRAGAAGYLYTARGDHRRDVGERADGKKDSNYI